MKAITFVDRVKVYAYGGDGGNGCCSFRREKYVEKGGPDGGDGGRGGSVYLVASKDQASLLDLYYQPHLRAERGEHGRGKQCNGRAGRDLYVKVPCGTQVYDDATGEFIGEVVNDGDVLLVARGGRGGLGNMHFVTPSHRAPREYTEGEKGEVRVLRLELKTVAEVGLVGYPNAGKSTLLRALTDARPKVAPYPFTTLHPVLGTLVFDDFHSIRIADIPGLIKGAHQGVGLGHDFLRHIERTSFLVYVIDMAGSEGRDPVDDYRNLRRELKLYKPELITRPHVIVANKMDLPVAAENLKEFRRRTRLKPLEISAEKKLGLEPLKKVLHDYFVRRTT